MTRSATRGRAWCAAGLLILGLGLAAGAGAGEAQPALAAPEPGLAAPPDPASAEAPAAIAPAEAPPVRRACLVQWPAAATERVPFSGRVSFHHAGRGAGAVSYPAVDAGSFVAAVVVHGLFNEAMKRAQRDEMRAAADQVLADYGPVLDGFRYADLAEGLDEAQARPAAAARWHLEVAPRYAMTQDQTALVLDSTIKVRSASPEEPPAFDGAVKVVSAPLASASPADVWLPGQGAALKRTASALLREAIELAVRRAEGELQASAPARTFRYPEGGATQFERGTLLETRCDRRVLLTLRQSLLSVPGAEREGVGPGDCSAQADGAAPS